MQNGISPEGRHYYPAFPYTAYRLATRQDMADLFAFLQTLPASDTPSQPHQVGFPLTITRGIGLWNRLHLHDDFTVGIRRSDRGGDARAATWPRRSPIAPSATRRAMPPAGSTARAG
jgi:hypothetical protein